MSSFKYNSDGSRTKEVFTGKVAPSSFYPLSGNDDNLDDSDNEEILKRKRAWAELERE
jgi:hypothetical protein